MVLRISARVQEQQQHALEHIGANGCGGYVGGMCDARTGEQWLGGQHSAAPETEMKM